MAHIQTKKLKRVLEQKSVATMQELKTALSTRANITVRRALAQFGYRTSYSHGGRYYALDKMVQFNEEGLWSWRHVWFSRHGTLMATLEYLISRSEIGYFANELEQRLHVGVKESLLRLVNQKRLARERVSGMYLYCATKMSTRRRQLVARKAQQPENGSGVISASSNGIPDEVKAAIILFVSLLNEQQRRLFAGVQALQFGRKAERWIADLLGVHRQTVAKGRQQLLEGDVDFTRQRKQGAGRTPIEKKHQRSLKRSAD